MKVMVYIGAYGREFRIYVRYYWPAWGTGRVGPGGNRFMNFRKDVKITRRDIVRLWGEKFMLLGSDITIREELI